MATIERHVTKQIAVLDGITPCREAARMMREKGIGSVGVRVDGRIVGIITERDLVQRVMANDDDGRMPIREAMRTDLPMVPPTIGELETSELMRSHYTRHLLVQEKGEVIGLISMRSIIRMMLEEKQFLIDQLQTYIDGR